MRAGSSPLTRGIPEVCGADCTRCRFIPAHAGNTKFDGCMPPFPKVHPRSRGEYRGVFFIPFFNTGSSPLTRGILFEKVGAIGVQRFIPAHAGNTCLNSSRTASKKVHPRSRGEYDKAVTDQTHVMGSSPLTRGILFLKLSNVFCLGFIPAHAGNTGCCPFCFQDIQVHPRSRGEYIGLFSKQIAYRGSSPLTRGIPKKERE